MGRPQAAEAREASGSDSRDESDEDEDLALAAITPEDLERLWEVEVQAWGALLGGGALEHHLEDEYLAALRKYVEALRREQQQQGDGAGSEGVPGSSSEGTTGSAEGEAGSEGGAEGGRAVPA